MTSRNRASFGYAKSSLLAVLLVLFAPAALAQQFAIGAYHLQSSVRTSTTQYDYTYTADLKNTGATAHSVVGTVASSSPNTIVTKATVNFGTVPGNSTITSTDTFTIRQDRRYTFDPSSLTWNFAQTNAPTANAGPGQTVPVGTTVTLDGTGSTDPNGDALTYQWTLVSAPAGSTTAIVNPTAARPTLYIDKFGDYVVQLIVNDGVVSSTASDVTISTSHTAPTANAGSNQTVAQGSLVTLDGGGSVDPDGNPLTYAWTLLSKPSGSSATLSSTSAVQPTFTLDVFGTYTVQLIVSDTYLSSAPSTVTITTSHTPPVGNAGPGQSVPVGAKVTLDGTASKDVNGFPLTYQWALLTIPEGSTATLTGADTVDPTFTVDVAGSYVAQLIVNDGYNSSIPVTVTVSTELLPPTANAGSAQTVTQGATVQLDGSGSTDPNGFSLTYAWVFLTKPAGASASFSDPTAQKPTFVADKPGTYVAQLTVSDGSFSSTPATVNITVNAPAPTANAGPNQTVAVGDTVTLNGAGSSDPDGNPLTYKWSFLSAPGSTPALNDSTSATPTFVAGSAGAYQLQLIVNNGTSDSAASTMTVTAIVPTLTLSPSTTLTFADQSIGTSSSPKSVTATNNTAAAIALGSIGASGDFSSGMSTTCGAELLPTDSCSVSVEFTPSAIGTRSGTLAFNDNATASPQTVSLSGNGIAGAATKLVIGTQPSNVAAGSSISPAVTVLIEDSDGNTVTSANGAVSVTLGNNPGGATLGGATTVSAVSGVATFSGLSLNRVGNGYTLIATGSGLTGTTTSAFNVTPGAATKLAFTVQPSNTTAGASISPAVTVTVQDADGNTVTSATNAITIAIGTNPASGTLSGTQTVSAVNGVATFSDLSINSAGNSYTLAASSGSLTGTASNSFNITAGVASKLAFTVQPSNATSQTAISPSIQVSVEDANNNVVTGATNSVTLVIATNPGNGSLSGTLTAAAVNGVATFSNVAIDHAGTGYVLRADGAGLTSGSSAAFNITAGPAAKVVFSAQPSTTAAGASIAPAVTVTIQDAQGNTVTSATNAVTLALAANPGSGTLSGTATANAVNGVATFANLSVDKAATGYSLSASSPTLTSATSALFNITPGTAAKLVFLTQPSATAPNAAITPAVTVAIEDSNGNTVTSSTASVTISIGANPGTGTLGGTATVNAVAGVASFANLTINNPGTGYTLAAASTGLTPATSSAFNVTAGPATKLAFTVQPANTNAGGTINQVQVSIQDAGGNTVLTSTASVTLAIGTNPGSGTLSGTLTVAAVNGVATFSNLSIDHAGTGYTLAASSAGLTGAASSAFNVTPGAATKLAFVQGPTTSAAGATITPALTVAVEDAAGNTVTTATNAVTIAIGTNPSSGTLSGTVTVNAVNGVASFSTLSINKAGTGYSLSATSPTLTSATSALFNITPGTAAKLVFLTQPSATAPNAAITPAVTVAIEDGNGNTVTSSTASVSIAIGTNPGSGTLGGTATVNAVAGVASFANLTINNPGTGYTLAAASTGLTSATSSAFNITAGPAAKLAFTVQPANTNAGATINQIQVSIQDAGGNTVLTSTASVTLAIGTNPSSGTLSGTLTVAAVNGVAVFTGLSINNAGTGYSLTATSSGLTSATSNSFNIVGSPITLNVNSPLVGIGSTLPGSFTLGTPAPVGGVVVNLASSVPANVTISPASVSLTQGQTSGAFTYTGVANGNSILSASATGYATGSTTVTATSSLISLGSTPTITLGGSQGLPLSLGTAAPAGGVTVTLTSDNTAIATVTSSVFIPAGATVPSANPLVTGVSVGTANISATATGFAPNSRSVTVSTTATITPSPLAAYKGITTNATLTISGAAPTGGLTFTLSTDNTADATVPATVTVLAGSTTTQIPVTGTGIGTTTLRADYPGITEATDTVNVAAPPAINVNPGVVGNNTYTNIGLSLGAAPTTNETMTITSNDPTHFLLSTSTSTVGSASLTVPITQGSTSVPTIYIQGQNYTGTTAITATITATATGYSDGTGTASLYPTGLSFLQTTTINTTTFSSPSNLNVYLVVLNPGTLTGYTYGDPLGPQAAPISAAIVSSTTSVGTITGSPATIPVGAYYNSNTIQFQPVTAGTTNLTITQPAGYSTPSGGNYSSQQIVATVTSPGAIRVSPGVVGNNTYTNIGLSLPIAPLANGTMTVTSSDPTHFLLSTSTSTVGSASITVDLTKGSTSIPTVYIQGQNYTGSTAITATITASATAAGYSDGTGTASLYPTGLSFLQTTTINTTTFSSPSNLNVYLVVLNPGTLTGYTYGDPLGPQAAPISAAIVSSTTSVGTITGSPATIPVGAYYNSNTIQFQPVTAGTTNLTITQPAGYSTPSGGNYSSQQIVATVTSPGAIRVSPGVVGNNTYTNIGLSLPIAPLANGTMTVTSSDPTHFLLSTSTSTVGSASITVDLTKGSTSIPTVYIQGQNYTGSTAITATITASATAAGYSDGTGTASLYPTGLSFLQTTTINTTTFSSPSNLNVYLVVLNPGTLTGYTYGDPLGPQAAPISAAIVSSTTSVGTITGSPATIPVGAYYNSNTIQFQPVTAGTTNLTITQPAGYSTPSGGNYSSQQIVATVTSPTITVNPGVVGNNTYTNFSVSIGAAPPSDETMTITSSDPTNFLLSTSSSTVGSASVTVTLTKGSTSVPTVYIQGQNFNGTAAITGIVTASAAGYSNGTGTASLYPTGLSFLQTSTLNTTTSSSPSNVNVYLVVLNPGSLTGYTYGDPLGPQAAPISAAIVSSTTSVGTISGSPASIPVGAYYNSNTIQFHPLTAGTTDLTLTQPAGYSTPSGGNYSSQQITATVTN